MRLHHSRLLAVALTVTLAAGPTFAADPAADTSLALVPADAAFYSASLKLGDQWDRFVQSNAYAKLKALPAVQAGLERCRAEAEKPDTPIGHIAAVLKDPANQELVDLLRDAARQEIFAYGGANWAQVIPVLQELQGAQQFGRLGALLSGQIGQADQSKAQARAMLAALNESRDKLQVPELVIGLRTTKKGAAAAQIK